MSQLKEEMLVKLGLDSAEYESKLKQQAAKTQAITKAMTQNMPLEWRKGKFTPNYGKQEISTVQMLGGAWKATGIAATGAIVAVGAAFKFFSSQWNEAFNESRQAKLLGVSTAMYHELGEAAERAGMKLEEGASAMFILTRTVGEAARGEKAALEAFASLGVELKDQSGKFHSMDQIYADVAKRLSEMEDPAKRASLGFKILGRSAKDAMLILEKLKDAPDAGERNKAGWLAGAGEGVHSLTTKIAMMGRDAFRNFAAGMTENVIAPWWNAIAGLLNKWDKVKQLGGIGMLEKKEDAKSDIKQTDDPEVMAKMEQDRLEELKRVEKSRKDLEEARREGLSKERRLRMEIAELEKISNNQSAKQYERDAALAEIIKKRRDLEKEISDQKKRQEESDKRIRDSVKSGKQIREQYEDRANWTLEDLANSQISGGRSNWERSRDRQIMMARQALNAQKYAKEVGVFRGDASRALQFSDRIAAGLGAVTSGERNRLAEYQDAVKTNADQTRELVQMAKKEGLKVTLD